MFVAIFIIVPSILLSGFIFPIEAIPSAVRVISYLLPFTYFVEIIRGLLIKQTLLVDLLYAYGALVSFVIVFVSASVLKFKQSL